MARTLPVLLACLLLALVPAGAAAQDREAPHGAEPHWLPDEEWVNLQWLPFDEDRLYAVLRMSRGQIFRHVRIDASNTLAQLARRRGMSAQRFADRLVAGRRGRVSARAYRTIRRNTLRTVTQGHLGQHLLFHNLHQTAIPSRAARIFGTRSNQQFALLRRSELSPLQIGDLFGRTRVQLRRATVATLRAAAARGVRKGQLSPRQARAMLERQERQIPRWLGQNRYNGPSGGRNRLRIPPGDTAKRPALSADGGRVVWDAYRTTIAVAERLGEIHVQGAHLARPGRRVAVSPRVDPRSRRPRSAYNSVLSADGRFAAFETAESTFPLAKRVGQMSILVRDLQTGATQKVSHLGLAAGAPTRTAFNPSISGDGRLVAFEATDSGTETGLWVVDRVAGTQRLLTRDNDGAAYLPRISADGSTVVFTAARGGGVTRVYRTTLADGATSVVSDGEGTDAYDPAVSADGRTVAYTTRVGGRSRIVVRDLAGDRSDVVSAAAPGDAFSPAVSADGRYVAFGARTRVGSGLLTDLRAQVHRVDRVTGHTVLVSARRDGRASAGYAAEPQISADGARVAFSTTAGDLVAGKRRGLTGVVVRDLAAGTTVLLSDHRRGSLKASAVAAHDAAADPLLCPVGAG
ncbi:MAG TPA: hypothetical protein VD931_08360 [Baekduia sp.]|nr:hypothetical protein [Baekduia sp.]